MSESIEQFVPQMIEDRRRIHARPELGWTEFETTALVIERLESLGYEVHTGLEVINPDAVLGRDSALVEKAIARARAAGVSEALLARMQRYTGAVGVLRTGRPGPVLALRFDMDALPIQEITDAGTGHLPAEGGFASTFAGVMHACGHDAHTAMGLATAAWIMAHKAELKGTIKLLFQPSEEGTRGAAAMAAAGVVDDADWFFGGHCGVSAKPHQIHIIRSGFLATTKFDVNFKGLASHAGGNPEKGRSALIAAANCAIMLTAIPRTSQGDTRIAVGRLDAGEGRNITPVHAHMECEVRGSTHEANQFMFGRAQEVIAGCAAMTGTQAEIIKTGEATTMDACDEAVAVEEAAARQAGLDVTIVNGCAGSEDCTMLTHRVMEHGGKAGFFLWGCTHKGHHRPDFDVQDTENMPAGLTVFAGIVRHICGA